MFTKSLASLAGLALVCVSNVVVAAPEDDPQGWLDRSFTEYLGEGPIGNNNVNDNQSFYWFFESSGVYEGQAVESWFLFWDPKRGGVEGSVSFATPILHVFDQRSELIATSAFGKPGVDYDYGRRAVGLEPRDIARTSFSDNVLSLKWFASNPGDHIRVMTAIPEPAGLALLAAGLMVTAALVRRRRAG